MSSKMDWTTSRYTIAADKFNEETSPNKGTVIVTKWGHLVQINFRPIRIAPGLIENSYEILPKETLPKPEDNIEFLVSSLSKDSQRLQIATTGQLNVVWSVSSPNAGREFIGTIVYFSKD